METDFEMKVYEALNKLQEAGLIENVVKKWYKLLKR